MAPEFSEDTLVCSRHKSWVKARHQPNREKRNQHLHHDVSVNVLEDFWKDKAPLIFRWTPYLTVQKKLVELHLQFQVGLQQYFQIHELT